MGRGFNVARVGEAFGRLREQFAESKKSLDKRIVSASQAGDYDVVKRLIEQAQGLMEFMDETDALYTRFAKQFDQASIPIEPAGPSAGIPNDAPTSGGVGLVLRNNLCEARAVFDQGSVTLLRGSTIAVRERESLGDESRKLRRDLRSLGKLVDDATSGTSSLQVDRRFSSPSAAACFVVGYSANGRREWVVERTGECLGDWLTGKRAE